MSDLTEPTLEAQSWMLQWRAAAGALDDLRTTDLRKLDDASCLAAFVTVAPTDGFVCRPTSGLIAQQEIFHRIAAAR